MACLYITGLEANNVDIEDAENLSSRAAAPLAGVGKSSVNNHRAGKCACTAPDVPGTTPEPTGRRDSVELGPDGGSLVYHTTDEQPIRDWSDVLQHLGVDPEKWAVVGDTVRVSRWQQSSKEGGERDSVWLSAYKAQITPKRDDVDLPALYAEARATAPAPRSVPVATGRTAVVAWADVQTGKVDHLGGTKELLARLDEKRAALNTYLNNNPTERVIVADVGDVLEGYSNVESQVRTNDLSMMDQVDVAATEMWKTIKLASRHAPVDVLSIPSNHCQWRNSKSLIGRPNDDWGIHINKRLEHLAGEVGLDATFYRPLTDWEEALVHEVHGVRLGLVHGHQAGSPDKVPAWWAKMSHANAFDADIFLSGHFHHLRVQPSGRSPRTGRSRMWVQAPTIDNGSSWVANKMGEDGDPGLLVFTITEGGMDLSTLAVL